jgi:hypothetical protein
MGYQRLTFASAFIRKSIYQLFKDKDLSKSTIKDCENGFPCVVKPKLAKPRVADKNRVITACVQENQHHTWLSGLDPARVQVL